MKPISHSKLSSASGLHWKALQREGRLQAGGRLVRLEEMSEPRPGQRAAFIMDTRLCDAAFALAAEAFGGPIVLARDLQRIPVPPRPPARADGPLPPG
jgi:hypothetical protein